MKMVCLLERLPAFKMAGSDNEAGKNMCGQL
jgi:hypothetical protein